jgi:hypothetical protein
MTGASEAPAASRQAVLLRNALLWIALAVFYAAAFRPFMAFVHALELSGGIRILIGFAFHVAYGVAGYYCFTGPQWLRQVLVFGALLANGIFLELLVSSYMYESILGMFVFGIFSAIGVGLGRLLQRMMAFCTARLRERNSRRA